MTFAAPAADALPMVDLPTDLPRRAGLAAGWHRVPVPLPTSVRGALEALAVRLAVEPSAPLVAALTLLVRRYCEADVVPVSVVSTGGVRGRQVAFEGLTSFDALVRRVHAAPEETAAPMPQVGVSNGPLVSADGVASEWVLECEQGAPRALHVRAALFRPETGARAVGHLLSLLAAALDAPASPLEALPLCTPEELAQQRSWNAVAVPFPREVRVERQFSAQAARRPEAIALSFGTVRVTYAELDARSNRLGRHLIALGVRPGDRVAIALERSVDFIVSLLAALKVGAAYLPIDPGYPDERVAFLIADAEAPVLLTHAGLAPGLPRTQAQVVALDEKDSAWLGADASPLPERGTAEDAAYVLYTSGTTGRPKGVVVPHHAISRLIHNQNYVQLGPDDRLGHISNVSFDAATYEIWGAFLMGGTLVGVTREQVLDLHQLAQVFTTERVTSTFFTVTLFNTIVRDDPRWLGGMRTLLIGGEALDPVAVRTFLSLRLPVRLLNGYGPTECTTFAACHHIREVPEDATSIPIGSPIANTELWVLDPRGRVLPVGVVGELFIGGDGVALGYHQRPELTAERFVTSPHLPGKRLYRTGDRVRRLADGTIDYLGRFDDQVKVRGFRIELGEIETALRLAPGVEDAAVAVRLIGGSKALVGYLLSAEEATDTATATVRTHLERSLPAFMIPTHLMWLPAFPVSPNGKLDRRALPEPPLAVKVAVTPLQGAAVRLVAEAFEAVLGAGAVSPQSDFFELGGHSLAATRLILQLERRTGIRLPITAVFEGSSVAELADRLRAAAASSTVDARPLSPEQSAALEALRSERLV